MASHSFAIQCPYGKYVPIARSFSSTFLVTNLGGFFILGSLVPIIESSISSCFLFLFYTRSKAKGLWDSIKHYFSIYS